MYKHYENITREILDTIKIGDLVRVNDWMSPMLVKAGNTKIRVTEHFNSKGKHIKDLVENAVQYAANAA